MFLLPKLTEASKSKKNDSKFSPKTKQFQNLFRYSSLSMSVFVKNIYISMQKIDYVNPKIMEGLRNKNAPFIKCINAIRWC